MRLQLLFWSVALAVCFWLDVFLFPSAGLATPLWLCVVVLSFAARRVPVAAGGALGALLGLCVGVVSAGPAAPQVASGLAAGALTAHLARAYVSHRSLLSAAATSFLCAAVFWTPPVLFAAAETFRGDSGAGLGFAFAAAAVQASTAAAVSVPFLLMQRAGDARIRYG